MSKNGSLHQSVKWQIWVLAAGFLLLIAKFIAYFLTNSNAILTDALESIVNVVAGMLALYSLWLASQPKDKNHPYGHGKIEFVSSSVEGILIIIAGTYMIGKATFNFFNPHPLHQLETGIIITTVAGAVNFLVGHFAITYGKKINSIVLEAEGHHLKSDAYTTVGMLLGLSVVYFFDYLWLDNVIAILFGGLISYTGFRIIKRSLAGIMDEADQDVLTEVLELINQNRRVNWIDLHNLRIIKYGHQLHIDAHITLPWYLNVQEAHREVELIDQLVNNDAERPIEFFVHVDPCIPDSCRICAKEDCQVRKHPFEQKIIWTLDNVLQDKKHKISV